jgi:beta-lactamase regulating signal transducer with metallopeptidase domain
VRVVEALLGLNGVWQVETLLQLLWQSFLIVSSCALAARVARGMGSRVQHRIWTMGLAALIILPFVPGRPTELSVVVRAPSFAISVDNPAALNAPRGYAIDLLANSGFPIRSELLTSNDSIAGPGLFGWIFLAWLAGAFIMLTHLAVGLARVRSCLRHGDQPPPRIQRIFERESAGCAATLLIANTPVPFTFGWRSTTIALPAAAVTWSDAELLAVLRHELVHVRRGDWIRQIVLQVVARIYWINPLVERGAQRASLHAEIACDQAVIASGVSPRSYALQLIDVSMHGAARSNANVALTFVRPNEVESRIRSLALTPQPRHFAMRTLLILMLLSAALVTSLYSRPLLGACDGRLPVRLEFSME